MAINFAETTYAGGTPKIWRGECKMLPGGFAPSDTFAVDAVLYRGTPLAVDFAAMTAAVCKAATVTNVGTATKPRVAKGHLLAVGDKVIVSGSEGATATNITAIDTTNAEYDILTINADITDLAVGNVLVSCDADGVALLPNAVVGADKHFTGKGLPTIDAAYDAVVLYPSLGFPIASEWVQGIAFKNNPNIILIKQ